MLIYISEQHLNDKVTVSETIRMIW